MKPRLFWIAQWRPVPFPAFNGREKKQRKLSRPAEKREPFFSGVNFQRIRDIIDNFFVMFPRENCRKCGSLKQRTSKIPSETRSFGPLKGKDCLATQPPVFRGLVVEFSQQTYRSSRVQGLVQRKRSSSSSARKHRDILESRRIFLCPKDLGPSNGRV